jgi:hypothetical protein
VGIFEDPRFQGVQVLAFPKNKVDHAVFSGIEQEGPFKGVPTYFIVGDVPLELIRDLCRNPSHLYFGAGGRFDYNASTVASVATMLYAAGNPVKITVENPVVDLDLLKRMGEFMPGNFLWTIPIMWQGLPCEAGLKSLKNIDRQANEFHVAVKIDTGYSTYSTRLSNFPYSHYNDYGDDELLFQKDKE